MGGNGKVLDLSFDQDYELGVKIGSSELLPRIALTSAPYALSLRGSSNQFPSSGPVLADTILVNGGIKVNNGVLAKGGAPGVNGANKAGYAFSGNNGDNDSGLFSTADGKASLYSNNKEILSVTPGTVTIDSSNLNIAGNGTVKYNGVSDWRLVDTDDFTSDFEGWAAYPAADNYFTGWNNAATMPLLPLVREDWGTFVGHVLHPKTRGDVLKKLYTISGSFTQIKVKFKYYVLDSWDFDVSYDVAWAGFATGASGQNLRIGWSTVPALMNFNISVPTSLSFAQNTNFAGVMGYTDFSLDVEMTARRDGNLSTFWVYIGAFLDGPVATDESYAIGPVEIWVR